MTCSHTDIKNKIPKHSIKHIFHHRTQELTRLLYIDFCLQIVYTTFSHMQCAEMCTFLPVNFDLLDIIVQKINEIIAELPHLLSVYCLFFVFLM